MIQALVKEGNEASIHLCEKLGFQYTGRVLEGKEEYLSDEERAKHNAKLEEIRNRAPQEPIKYEPPQNVKPVDKEDLEA